MKRCIILLLAVLSMLQYKLSAQDSFIYKMQGEKLYLQEDSIYVVINFKSLEYTADSAEIISIIKSYDNKSLYEELSPQMIKVQTSIPFDTIIYRLSNYSNKLSVSKVYYPISDNHIHWCSNRVIVMIHSENLLRSLLNQLSIEYEEISVFNNDSTYILTLPGIEDRSIQVSNLLYETGQVNSAQPDFCFIAELYNAHYGYQWGLHNTGQYGQAYSGIDIKAPEAWDITRGNNIKVAVIDCGVDLTHPDLSNNLQQGYDAANGAYGVSNGECIHDIYNGHGTCCAGIIAAENNTIGTVGVASDSKIIPIRMGYSILDGFEETVVSCDSWVASSIYNAWYSSNADILSFSTGSSYSDIVNTQLCYALTLGRNGKGCIIVASSGNYDNVNHLSTSVIYPASNDNVIAVGAISTCGNRKDYQSCDGEYKWGSCYGPELSVVAPGVLIPTTDVQGNYGYNPLRPLHILLGGNTNYGQWSELTDYDYTKYFTGTSAAAPHVSGVAALMLSVNPNLTTAQVKTIIEKTAQRIRTDLYTYTDNPSVHPNGTWNNQMGYGLVDAHRAVMEAYFFDYHIEGNLKTSGCGTYYQLDNTNIPNNTIVQWSVSNNLEIVSSTNTSAYIRAVGTGAGTITISFTHEGYTVTKEIQTTTAEVPISDYYYNYSTTGNMTFSNELYINGTFTINSNNVVTVSGSGYCFPDSKIVIQPGGKLVIDGGELTNYCPNKMWDGIYVVGNKNQLQYAQYQGTLEIKNGSLIENAKNAINVWDGTDINTSGGIVKCENTVFHNNRQCAYFPEYNAYVSGTIENGNKGKFSLCNFIVDDNNLFSANNTSFMDFVEMEHVNGLRFSGCQFKDMCTSPIVQGFGIKSIDTGYKVEEYCPVVYDVSQCFCPTFPTTSRFQKMSVGIDASNTGTNYVFSATRSSFDTCGIATAVTAVNNFKFTENYVKMLPADIFNSSIYVGLAISNSSGYKVEGNNFYSTNTSAPTGFSNIGVWAFASGTADNTIYRNTMNKLNVGILSNNNPGLQFQCNEFLSSYTVDIHVWGANSYTQGSSTKSAGNKFTSGGANITSSNYCNPVTYYHSGNALSSNVYYPASTSNNITTVANVSANNCKSTLCTLPIINPQDSGDETDNDISLYESLRQMYELHLVEYNAAGYGFLLENFENSDADIVAFARQKQDTLISIRRTMAEIANRNIDAILQDTLIFDRGALNGWYNRINTITAKYSLVNSYFEMGEYALANQELALIPLHFALSSNELAEYDNFCQYNTLRESVYTSGRRYAQLTENEIAELQTIVERNTGVSSAYANSVLCFYYGICRDYEEMESDFDIDAPMNSKSTTAVAEDETSDAEQIAIYVYPNPADEELNILLKSLPEGKTMIEFHDVAGRLVLSKEIKGNNTSINISSLKQGVYMYRIVNGGNIIVNDMVVKK